MAITRLERFEPLVGYAPVVLRLFLGTFLVFMSQDNVFSATKMREFEGFLAGHGFPLPAIAAPLSVYAQLACGALILVGAFTRWAALVMVVNFTIAILGVHLALPFRTWLEPSAMLATSAALVLSGAGKFSLDALPRNRRRAARA